MSVNGKIQKLEEKVQSLSQDVDAIVGEHERYRLIDQDAENFFSAFIFPIETLRESLEREHGSARTKYSLKDLRHKFSLGKLHRKTLAELETTQQELRLAKIDGLLETIRKETSEV